MAKGRAVAIVLEAGEKSELTALTRKHGAPQALAERARIVLAAAAGLNNKEIAGKVGVCTATAGTWRNRFAERGGPGCLNRFSASISGASAGVRLPCGGAAG